ncbi:SlyX family protein [Psychrobacter sp. DAB_AL32B]|uniref:SlyX family protein n=1 Tax=Psychrobacter sp. DAB_AL32B TaxID=1028414 RepID=UPI000B7EBBFF|nr:SlyX family protein [Psychrobacter sp. DAB_AL32B]OXL27991.1 SlyX protein [Psychrobacter sp. DAB_AL32B]
MNEANPQSINLSNLQTESLATQADLQSQVVELQMNMSHLELTVERLDDVITRQDKHIQTLQRQLQFIYKQVESQDEEGGVAPFDVMADRPPHY